MNGNINFTSKLSSMKKYTYGVDKSQFGHLYRPSSSEYLPVMVIIHGGYWKDNHSLDSYATKALADEFIKINNVAIWNIEYRRMNSDGENKNAPWPGILNDVADAMDFLKEIEHPEKLDLSKIIAIGHSAGGHLAAWLTSRNSIDKSMPFYRTQPVLPAHTICIAGILDILSPNALSQPQQIKRFIGGNVSNYADRYHQSNPISLWDGEIPITIVHGKDDNDVDISQSRSFVITHRKRPVQLIELANCDHFGMLPLEGNIPEYWPVIIDIIKGEIDKIK